MAVALATPLVDTHVEVSTKMGVMGLGYDEGG
jgi:hypothetical protein